MCKFKLFSIAAAALMMVACSNEDLTQQTQTKAGKMQFSATLAAPNKGGTRTVYTEDTQNKKITVAWKVDDEIALVHDKVMDVVKVKTVNADGSATITGYVTGATNNADVRLVYPAARVGTVTGGEDGTEYTADETVEGKLKTQDGTLAYIQDNLDFREDMGQLAVNGTEVTLAEKAAEISPLLAIWKLTLSDGTNNLSATQVKIKGGESVLASTTTLTAGTSVVTLAIPNVAIDGALTIEATVGSDTYTYTKAQGPTFNSGTYYQSMVTMAKASAEITVTITQNDLPPTGNKSFTKDGVTVTAENMIPSMKTIMGPGSFTTTLGNFTKIEVTGDGEPTGTGWSSGVWTGNASTVEFTGGSIAGFISDAFTIVCTIQPAKATTVNLSNLTADYEAKNGETLTGTLAGNYKISIAAGATVTLDGVTISGVDNNSYSWAGITCAGDATIILKDGSTNTVQGFKANYPGIHVPEGKTLIIKGETQGTGKLIASSNVNYGQEVSAAGIGGGSGVSCGNIEIQGGDITATGGYLNAGIGGGCEAACGTITISGGTINATGGEQSAGIGSGYDQSSCGIITISGGTITATGKGGGAGIGSGDCGSSCGTITITDGVTKVTATKGTYAPNSIGAGAEGSTCGTVTIEEGANSKVTQN